MSDEFSLNYSVDQSTGCWVWLGAKSEGYGNIRIGKTRKAHRVAYEMYVGPVPQGLELDHLCRNRACINPDHLEPVTHKENVLRGFGAAAQNARKLTCSAGHKLPETDGRERRCQICETKYQRDYHLKHRQDRLAAKRKQAALRISAETPEQAEQRRIYRREISRRYRERKNGTKQ